MSNANNAPALTDAERAKVMAYIRKGDTKAAPRRGVLGLAPARDDEYDESNVILHAEDFRSTLWEGQSEADLACAHSLRGAIQQFDSIMGLVLELHNRNVSETNILIENECAHRRRIESLETKLADMALVVAELKGAAGERARTSARPAAKRKTA
jgi:hypothetical protein